MRVIIDRQYLSSVLKSFNFILNLKIEGYYLNHDAASFLTDLTALSLTQAFPDNASGSFRPRLATGHALNLVK